MTQFINLVDLLLHHKIAIILLLISLRIVWLVVYRLYLHPLAKFPGPRLAAATVWYEFYWDGLRRGQYTFEIGRMHEKYGPIVRISPDELHVNDPEFIDTLYAGGGKRRDKYPYYTGQFGISEGVFATNPHDHHRLRRNALNRYFSKASISKLEPVIHEIVQKLCLRIQQHAGSEKPVTISMAFSCMATDVVTQYMFAKSYNFLETDSPGFEKNLHESILVGTEMGVFTKQFPWLLTILQAVPISLVEILNPTMGAYLQFQSGIRAQIKEIKEINEINESIDQKDENSGKTVFHELLTGNLPEHEKTVARLWQEGQTFIGAGTETTAWTLSVIIYYILSEPMIFSRLYQELESAIPNPAQLPPLSILEQLPYLIIVEYQIPPGTPVGMTSVLIHHNPNLFPDPKTFSPKRWLDDKGKRCRDLDGYIMSFSKGSRQCIGINLAHAELFMALAAIVRTFGDRMELYETGLRDVEIQHDVFIPLPFAGTKGIRVLIKS